MGEFAFCNNVISVSPVNNGEAPTGLYGDADKIPKTAVIRTKRDGDVFKKFGGGTKKLVDFFTDKKIPIRLREEIPLLADGNDVLVVFGIAVSDKIRTDDTTEKIIKFTYREE